jgi:hypothetical protein
MRNEVLSLMRRIMRPGRALGVSICGFTTAGRPRNAARATSSCPIRVRGPRWIGYVRAAQARASDET